MAETEPGWVAEMRLVRGIHPTSEPIAVRARRAYREWRPTPQDLIKVTILATIAGALISALAQLRKGTD